MTYTVDVIEVRMGFKIDIELYRYIYIYRLISSFPGEAARYLPSVGTRSYVGSRILPALYMPQSHFLRQSLRKCSPCSPMKASQGSYFPTDSPSSGVTLTGPQVSTCPPTCSCQEGVPPLKSHFHSHGDEGIWRCPRRVPSGGQAWCGQL